MPEEEEVLDEEKKNKLIAWIEEHPKTVFWLRFALWTLFSCVLPFLFIIFRFEIFPSISKMRLSGFGVIAIVIVAFFVFAILRYIRIALSAEYSLIGQIINGFCKIIIPLIAALLILNSVKSSVDLMMQALGCVIACEAVAIPFNPLPKWAYERQKDVRAEERKEAFDYLLDGFFKRKKDE